MCISECVSLRCVLVAIAGGGEGVGESYYVHAYTT